MSEFFYSKKKKQKKEWKLTLTFLMKIFLILYFRILEYEYP